MAVTDNPYPGPILRLTRGKSNLVWIVMVFLVIRVLVSAVGVQSGVAALTRDWPETISPPWVALAKAGQMTLSGDVSYVEVVNILFFLIIVLLLVIGIPKVRPALTIFCFGSLMMLLLRDTPVIFQSFPRYALTFLSTFIVLGKWGDNRRVNRLLLPVFLLVHIWFLFVYFSWGWVA